MVASSSPIPTRALVGSLSREAAVGVVLVGIHFLWGVAMASSDSLATAHAAATVLVIAVVMIGTLDLRASLCCVAYLSISDILWRMSGAPVFWETAKLGLIAFGVLRLMRWPARLRMPAPPVAYALLLAPGAVLTLTTLAFDEARQQISFNLGGPIALAVCSVIFANVRFDVETLRWIILSLALPTVTISGLAFVSTVETADQIVFGDESNFLTSAGFGPNQVSTALGLGALCMIVLALIERATLLRLVAAAGAVGLLAQAALTFSRGGVVNVAVALLVGLVVLGQRFRAVLRSGPVVILAVLFGLLFVVPRLDAFTDGALEERFRDIGATNRGDAAQADLDIFWQNEIVGVGPGVSSDVVGVDSIRYGAAHTEYTRVLAEHGALGAAALLVLVAMIALAIYRAEPGLPRALVATFAAWALTDMAHAAMRTGAVSFALALALGCSQMTTGPLRARTASRLDERPHGDPRRSRQARA